MLKKKNDNIKGKLENTKKIKDIMRKNNRTVIKPPNQWFEKIEKIMVLRTMIQLLKNYTMCLKMQTNITKS